MSHTASTSEDARFTAGLYIDVVAALKKHGYVASSNSAVYADVLVDLLQMVRHFEGRHATDEDFDAGQVAP